VSEAADEPRAYVRHVRAAGICMRGARQWAAGNGFSWADFVTGGVPLSTLRAQNNAFANRVVEAVKKEQSGG
jgi:hypothetical protein